MWKTSTAITESCVRMLLDPGWRQDDFERLKDEVVNFLRIQLRSSNEEELGKEFLYNRIYQDHPYGWHNSGTVSSLEKLTLEDLKGFYKERYTAGNVVIGLAGGYPKGFSEKVEADFSKLPEGKPEPVALPTPQAPEKLNIRIIEKDTRGNAHRPWIRHPRKPQFSRLAGVEARAVLPGPAPLEQEPPVPANS